MPRLNPVFFLQEYNKLQPRSANPVQRLIQPEYDYDWSSFPAARITCFIKQINGSPTAWSFKPRLQVGITSTSGYQYTNGFWKTLTPAQAAALTEENAWLPDLALVAGATSAGDTITAAHSLAVDAPINFPVTGGATNIVSGTTYYVVSPTATTFKVAATPGGTPIALGTATGISFVNNFPDSWSVTIVNPPAAMRIDFGASGANALTMTGGTNPSIQASCVAYPKG